MVSANKAVMVLALVDSSVQDVNGMNAEVKTAFTKTVVSVEGANGYQAIDYKVYVMDMANANDTANTYKVTI